MILLEILIWLLAGLVGLIFVILLAVLYIPIRYKLQAVSRDERRALIMVTWFGGLLRFSFQYQQGQGFKSQFSLFGKMIKPGPHKKTKKQARKKKARKRPGSKATAGWASLIPTGRESPVPGLRP
jgi:hypothetical protein